MNPKFPVAVLDLETEKVRSWTRKALNEEKPLLIGLLIARSPRKIEYKTFGPDQCQKLDGVLSQFVGPILTYNGLRFDFFVLEKRIDIRKILRRSFDLFYWLKSKVGKVKGSRLEDLAQENLGVGKTGSWESGIRAWRRGNKKPMIRYNKMDCLLPLRLFSKLMDQGYLRFQEQKIQLSSADRRRALGQVAQVSYDHWLTGSEFSRTREIRESFEEAEGNYWEVMLEAMGHDPAEIREFGVENLLRSHSGTEHVHCSCGKYFSLSWTEWPGFRDVREVSCPNCGRSLGNYDVDHLGEVSKDEFILHAKRACPKDKAPLKFVKHFAYKPGSEEWDVLRCPKCRKEYQIYTV